MIPKQECCVILGGMDLTFCTETIENVSISGYNKIKKKENNDIVTRYATRRQEHLDLSLYQYYQMIKEEEKTEKVCIPHFIGGSGQPVYPVTPNYARTTLLIHKPWHYTHRPNPHQDWVKEFNTFINNPSCPHSVLVAYQRVRQCHLDKMEHIKPVAQQEAYDDEVNADLDDTTQNTMDFYASWTKEHRRYMS